MVHDNEPAPWAGIPPTGEMLRPTEAARRLGYSRPRFYQLAAKGSLPRPIKIGEGRNGASVVPLAWINAVLEHRMGSAAQ
jgi:predicted DNA-binding transcriptional regulator AlpA